MFNKLHKLAISIVTSGALVLALGSGAASAASQDSVVDSSKSGTIHLTKYDNAENAQEPNGAEAPTGQTIPANSKTLEGIKFTLTPITKAPDVPEVSKAVLTNKKLKELAKLRASDAEDALAANDQAWTFGTPVEGTTDPQGTIDWDNLDLGVYLLQETDSVASNGQAYKRSQTSLVFLPTTNPSGDGWLTDGDKYAVWVYPKNSQDDNFKVVDDRNKQVGDEVTYTVSSTVPAVHKLTDDEVTAANAAGVTGRTYDLNNFGFWDNLDDKLQLLNADSVTVKIVSKGGNSQTLDNADFVANVYAGPDADTTSPGTAVNAATTDGGQKLVVALTSAGLEKVAEAKVADQETLVVFSFSPKVVGSGIVPNKAQVFKTYGQEPGLAEGANPQLPFNAPTGADTFSTNTVVSAWGKIIVTKTDDKDTPTPLENAKFKVYGVNTVGKNDVIDWGETNDEHNLFKNQTFTSDAQGQVTIDGLHANNLENGGAAVAGYTKYALVETEAPEGYELAREPIIFTIDVASELAAVTSDASWTINADGVVSTTAAVEQTVKAEADAFAAGQTPVAITEATASLHRSATVVNIKVKPRLPLTGGAGIAIFGLLGGALLLGGLYAAKRNSRQAE